MEEIIVDTIDGQIRLGPNTLLFAMDETGHEDFNDPAYPYFGFGGCGCLVRDYSRLIEKPWLYMCSKYFSDIERPLHAANLSPDEKQIDSLNHFFTKFEFFRVSVLASKNTFNIHEFDTIELMANSLLQRVCDVGKWAEFDRVLVIFEESQRIEMKIIQSLAGKKIIREKKEIPLELGLMPKSSCLPALEVADFIVHTAGRQVRHRNTKNDEFLPDFTAVFKSVDNRLQSFMEIIKISS